MYCIKCGSKNVAGASYCYNCGTPMVRPTDTEPPAEQLAPSESQASSAPAEKPFVKAVPGMPPAGQYGPPPGVYGSPPPNGYGPTGQYGPPPGADPNWRPPYPYGYPPLPRPGEPQQFPVAPNGQPYVVKDHPESFYAYKNKDNKQVYASYATFQARLLAGVLDTILLYLPLQLAWAILIIVTNPNLVQRYQTVRGAAEREQLTTEINALTPLWLPLLIFTLSLAYCVLLTWRAKGQTLGKKLLRIKVIRKDGTPPDFYTAFTRNLFGYSLGLSFLLPVFGAFGTFIAFALQVMVGLGFFAVRYDKQKRGWHDRLAETLVVGKRELVQGENY